MGKKTTDFPNNFLMMIKYMKLLFFFISVLILWHLANFRPMAQEKEPWHYKMNMIFSN